MDKRLTQKRDEIVEHIRRELRALIHESGQTQRRIEEKNGYTQGYLSQVLQGHITLTVRHLYGILLAIGTSPEQFMSRISDQTPADELRERLARYEEALSVLEQKGILEPKPPREEE